MISWEFFYGQIKHAGAKINIYIQAQQMYCASALSREKDNPDPWFSALAINGRYFGFVHSDTFVNFLFLQSGRQHC